MIESVADEQVKNRLKAIRDESKGLYIKISEEDLEVIKLHLRVHYEVPENYDLETHFNITYELGKGGLQDDISEVKNNHGQ